jgi:hypothetical protein
MSELREGDETGRNGEREVARATLNEDRRPSSRYSGSEIRREIFGVVDVVRALINGSRQRWPGRGRVSADAEALTNQFGGCGVFLVGFKQ